MGGFDSISRVLKVLLCICASGSFSSFTNVKSCSDDRSIERVRALREEVGGVVGNSG